MSDWCILRMAGRRTLQLAETLSEDGFDVWTPVETRRIRIPRANVRREVKLPIMPSYIFARARHLIDLLQLAETPRHGDFSVMHSHEGIPLINDAHLHGLRRIEAKRTPRKKADRAFPAGVDVRVKIEGGSFGGMQGVVKRSDHGHTLVCFDNRLTVKISTSLLEPNVLTDRSSVALLKAA